MKGINIFILQLFSYVHPSRIQRSKVTEDTTENMFGHKYFGVYESTESGCSVILINIIITDDPVDSSSLLLLLH